MATSNASLQVFADKLDSATILQSLKTTGFCLLRAAFPDQTIAALIDESVALNRSKPLLAKDILRNVQDGSYCLSVQKRTKTAEADVPPHLAVAYHEDLQALARAGLGGDAGISIIIFDFRQPGSADELYPLHWDHFKISRCIKAYVHLSDADSVNGAIRLIPGSHNLIRDVLAAQGELAIEYGSDYDNSLSRLMALVEKTPASVLAPHAQTLRALREIVADPSRAYDYAVNAKKGDMLIFDPLVMHGGGKISGASRHTFRIHYVDRNYVNAYLPEQMSLPRYVAWKLRRATRHTKKLFVAQDG
jgi:hypothetical protein